MAFLFNTVCSTFVATWIVRKCQELAEPAWCHHTPKPHLGVVAQPCTLAPPVSPSVVRGIQKVHKGIVFGIIYIYVYIGVIVQRTLHTQLKVTGVIVLTLSTFWTLPMNFWLLLTGESSPHAALPGAACLASNKMFYNFHIFTVAEIQLFHVIAASLAHVLLCCCVRLHFPGCWCSLNFASSLHSYCWFFRCLDSMILPYQASSAMFFLSTALTRAFQDLPHCLWISLNLLWLHAFK